MHPIKYKNLTQEKALELFEYKDGILYWKVRAANCVHIGDKAGFVNCQNITVLHTQGKLLYAHRVIFLMHHGYCPFWIDHEDNNPLNNRIENLRVATIRQNCCNRRSAKGSSSKYLGVLLRRKVWYVASIRVNRKLHHLGQSKNEGEAALIYNRAAVKYHGEFANLNIIKPQLNG